MRKRNLPRELFFVLLFLVLFFGGLDFAKARGLLVPQQPEVQVTENIISLDDLTLEQKIAQMIVVHGGVWNLQGWKNLQVGGIHLFALEKSELFRETIQKFQQGQSIPFFVTADLEGCLNPFANFQQFPAAADIATTEQAWKKGKEEGVFLQSLGFTVNFAPVVDLEDRIWNCRSFPGNVSQVAELAGSYVQGLQSQGILATAKHYPGKTLVVRDPHKQVVAASIDDDDIFPYFSLSPQVKGIMISHLITGGSVNSQGVPAVTSPSVVKELKNTFSGLVISDEINMLGLRRFYPVIDDMYLAVFSSGNDLILNFNEDPQEVYRMIQVVKRAVQEGRISEESIDTSVRKILEAKGFTVK